MESFVDVTPSLHSPRKSSICIRRDIGLANRRQRFTPSRTKVKLSLYLDPTKFADGRPISELADF